MNSRLLPILALALLAGCESMPQGIGGWPGQPAEPVHTAQEHGGSPHRETEGKTTVATKRPSAVSSTTTESARAQAHKLSLDAADLLDQGKEDEAKGLLRQVIALDPDNKIANNLLRQITVDPVASLGKKSFKYIVRSGETLSIIAQRYMGDLYSFYILARYNDIRVPRGVQSGQVIRVPGDTPPESPSKAKPAKRPADVTSDEAEAAPPASVPAQEPSQAELAYQSGLRALRGGQKELAYNEMLKATRGDPEHKAARQKAEQLRQELVQQHTRNAMAAFHRQDLASAIRYWDKVLEFDPQNESARLKRQQAVDLAERVKAFPAK